MATIHLTETTTSTPEQFIAGLTDFGPGRSELFGNSADEYLKLHDAGPGWADVTEGSGGVWERLHYDWSDPNRVVMTTTDSNVWGGASGHTYTLTPQPDGTTLLDAVVIREGKNLKGRLLGIVLGTSRQARPGQGVPQERQGHRSAERRPFRPPRPGGRRRLTPRPCPVPPREPRDRAARATRSSFSGLGATDRGPTGSPDATGPGVTPS